MPKLVLFNSEFEYSDKVVIVEDDEADYVITERNFRDSHFRNDLVWLDSGEKLIQYLNQTGDYTKTGHKNPIVIFLDMNLPGKNGKDILQELRQDNKYDHLRIVILTNADKEFINDSGLRHMPYIQKPLNLEKLIHYVASHTQFLLE